jgi:hypothetical protein
MWRVLLVCLRCRGFPQRVQLRSLLAFRVAHFSPSCTRAHVHMDALLGTGESIPREPFAWPVDVVMRLLSRTICELSDHKDRVRRRPEDVLYVFVDNWRRGVIAVELDNPCARHGTSDFAHLGVTIRLRRRTRLLRTPAA